MPQNEMPLSLIHPGTRQNYKSDELMRLAGIPWVYAEPMTMLNLWQFRSQETLNYLSKKTSHLEILIKASPSPLTRKRLEALCHAHKWNRSQFENLLTPLNFPVHAKAAALFELLPTGQSLLSYMQTLFRDWGWPSHEREQSFKFIDRIWPKAHLHRGATLGSGTARLTLDLLQHHSMTEMICMDINPLLTLTTSALLSGKTLELYEFPINPLHMDHFTYQVQLQANGINPRACQLVLGDATSMPFPEESLDLLFTPWFLDIIPDSLPALLQRMNHVLQKDGYWIFYGPLGFEHRDESRNFSWEELIELA